jgi:hypothetical protein
MQALVQRRSSPRSVASFAPFDCRVLPAESQHILSSQSLTAAKPQESCPAA